VFFLEINTAVVEEEGEDKGPATDTGGHRDVVESVTEQGQLVSPRLSHDLKQAARLDPGLVRFIREEPFNGHGSHLG